jgi:hypothetical protein
MIIGAAARLRYFFRPFRKDEYQHAPSIEELHIMRQRRSPQITRLWRGFIRALTESTRR